jgi:uridine kinase
MKNKKSLIVNIYGMPSAGKSTTAAGVFSELKWLNIDCELATEYAKDKV